MLTIFFLANLDLGLEGVYYAQFGGIIVYFLVLAPFIFKNMETRFEWRELKNMVYFRFPFLLPIIALNLFQYNDRFLLTKIIDLDNAGIYSLGTKLANTIKTFLITAIWLALTPTIYKMMDKPGNKRFYAKLMTYLTFAITIVVMIFSFYSKEIVSLIAEDAIYLQAYKVMPLISLSILFAMLKDISLIGLNITKKTKPIAWVTIGVSALNIALNFFLIKELGMNGAALAILVSQFVFFIVIHRIAQTHYPIPYELNKVFVMIAVAITLYVAALAIQDITFWLAFAIKAMLIAAFPLILHFFNFYEPVELERLKGFWKKWRNPLSWVRNIQTLDF
jgi:O-antigen/teichoic acid export membrane protein